MLLLSCNKRVPALYKLSFADDGQAIMVKIWKNRWSSVLKYYVQQHTSLDFPVDQESDCEWTIVRFTLNSSVEDQMQTMNSLDRLLDILHMLMYTEPSDCECEQSATGSIFLVSDRNCFGACAMLSYAMRTWIATGNARNSETIISGLMRNSLVHLDPENSEVFAPSIRVRLQQDCRVSFQVWGDACDLSVYDPDAYEFGLKLGCHNLDTRTQPFALLMGLAGLCAEFEKFRASQ